MDGFVASYAAEAPYAAFAGAIDVPTVAQKLAASGYTVAPSPLLPGATGGGLERQVPARVRVALSRYNDLLLTPSVLIAGRDRSGLSAAADAAVGRVPSLATRDDYRALIATFGDPAVAQGAELIGATLLGSSPSGIGRLFCGVTGPEDRMLQVPMEEEGAIARFLAEEEARRQQPPISTLPPYWLLGLGDFVVPATISRMTWLPPCSGTGRARRRCRSPRPLGHPVAIKL